MTQIETATAALVAYNAATDKLFRNLNTCTFASLTRQEADPFVVYADKLERFEAHRNEALSALRLAQAGLSTEDLVRVYAENPYTGARLA